VSALTYLSNRSGAARAAGLMAVAGLCLAGCAQAPQPVAHHSHYKEHFAEGSYWGKASPRMVEDGQSIPRGGGQYLVGRPYTIGGRTYYPHEDEHYVGVGIASWYGDAFHGRKTANGEIYDKRALSAASPTMPLPSYARVTNLGNGYSVIVRVNDRGPYAAGRVMDVSSRVADVLDFKRMGTAHVKVEYVGRAPLEGSDDNQLLATLRTDGAPAEAGAGVQTAQNSEPVEPQPPEPPAVERPARRVERPAPVKVAAPEPALRLQSEDVADAEETQAPRRASTPLPPARPYDLGAKQAAFIPRPPVRPGSGDRALYFVDPPRPHDDPLARLIRHKAAQPDNE